MARRNGAGRNAPTAAVARSSPCVSCWPLHRASEIALTTATLMGSKPPGTSPHRTEMKRLLLITNYFPPCAASATHRCLAMAEHLPTHGWELAVIAPPAIRVEPTDPELTARIPPGTRVHHVPFPDRLWSRIMARSFQPQTWIPAAWVAVKQVVAEFRPDVVLSTSPPGTVHFLARQAKRRWGLPWVADMRDPWVSNPLKHHNPLLHKLLDTRAEAALMRQADLIVANTPGCVRFLKATFPHAAERIVLVTNGFDPLAQVTVKPWRPAASHLTLLHAGELYGDRDPRPWIRVLAALDRSPPPGVPQFRLKLLGRMASGLGIESFIREQGAQHLVDTPGQVSHAEVLAGLSAADVLVSIQGPSLSQSVPAKLYEYLAFGKPILQLATPGGDSNWVLETADVCHRVVSQSDQEGIRGALIELGLAVVSGRAATRDPERARVFTREHTMGQLASHLDRLLEVRAKTACHTS